MLRYKVPRNVERDDQILPFLTMKQLAVLAGGGTVCYIIFSILSKFFFIEIWGPIILIPVVLTIAIAFVNIYGVSFTKWLLLMFEYNINPQKRVWNNKISFVEKTMKALLIIPKNKKAKNLQYKETKEKNTPKSFNNLMKDINLKKSSYQVQPSFYEMSDFAFFDQEDEQVLNRLKEIEKNVVVYKNIPEKKKVEIKKNQEIKNNSKEILNDSLKKIESVRNKINVKRFTD